MKVPKNAGEGQVLKMKQVQPMRTTMSQQHDEELVTGPDHPNDELVHVMIDDKLEQVSASLQVFLETATPEDIETKSIDLLASYCSSLRSYSASRACLPIEMINLHVNNLRLFDQANDTLNSTASYESSLRDLMKENWRCQL